MTDLFEYGYWGLFLASFLAATVLPFSSEALLSLLIISGYDMKMCIIVATIGNWGGGMSSYFLGYLGKWQWIEKYLRVKREKVLQYKKKMYNKSALFAFLTWVPVVGDLIAICLGVIRSNIILVSTFMLLGKLGRYIVWGYLTYSLS